MTIEKRIMKDKNRFYHVQIRMLPILDWEPNDGWRTVFITSSPENAKKHLDNEPGKEVA